MYRKGINQCCEGMHCEVRIHGFCIQEQRLAEVDSVITFKK
jgi:hypothetical protein